MATIDLSLGNDPAQNVQAITAAAQPGNVVNLTGGTYPVDSTIKVNGASIVGGVGGTTLAVSRDALPTEVGPNIYRPHVDLYGFCKVERIKVVGRNLLKQQAGEAPGVLATEYEHAFRANGGASVAFFGCSSDFVWGDGVYIGQNGIAHDCTIDDFTSQGVGRQVVAVAHHTGVGLIRGVRIFGSTRRGGIDIEPVLAREVSGFEITECDLAFTRLLPLTVGGHGNVSRLNIHDNIFRGNEVRFQNNNLDTVFSDIRFERNSHTGSVSPQVRFHRVIRAVVMDNVTTRSGSPYTGTMPAIRVTECPDILVQRNRAAGVPVCVGINGDLTLTTGTIGAPVGDRNANTHTPAVGGQNLTEPVLGWVAPPPPSPPPPVIIPPISITPIDLNTATLEEIAALPATLLGKKKAALIIGARPVTTLDQLEPLYGISKSTIAAIRDSQRTVQR